MFPQFINNILTGASQIAKELAKLENSDKFLPIDDDMILDMYNVEKIKAEGWEMAKFHSLLVGGFCDRNTHKGGDSVTTDWILRWAAKVDKLFHAADLSPLTAIQGEFLEENDPARGANEATNADGSGCPAAWAQLEVDMNSLVSDGDAMVAQLQEVASDQEKAETFLVVDLDIFVTELQKWFESLDRVRSLAYLLVLMKIGLD